MMIIIGCIDPPKKQRGHNATFLEILIQRKLAQIHLPRLLSNGATIGATNASSFDGTEF